MIHRGYMFNSGGGLLLIAFFLLAVLGIGLLVLLALAPHRTAATAPPLPPGAYAAPAPPAPTGPPAGWPAPALSPARAILDERLARGEVPVEEYQRLRAALEGPGA